VKRLVGAAALAALALVLVLSSGGDVGPARAASTKCVWIKHTKRVGKHVRRHGKVHRVVTIKHYKSCRKVALPEAAPTPPATATPAPITPTEPTPPVVTPQPELEPNAVSITAGDQTPRYTYVPSRTTVKPGALSVQLIDRGQDDHNMRMQRVNAEGQVEGPVVAMVGATPTAPSQPTTVVVEAGATYRMWCTLPGHAANGMEAEITVE
jgi:plastocyanin